MGVRREGGKVGRNEGRRGERGGGAVLFTRRNKKCLGDRDFFEAKNEEMRNRNKQRPLCSFISFCERQEEDTLRLSGIIVPHPPFPFLPCHLVEHTTTQ